MSDEDDEYEVPLQHQRAFGAGLKRKRVKFVPSSASSTLALPRTGGTTPRSVGDLYLNIVLPNSSVPAEDTSNVLDGTATKTSNAKETQAVVDVCDVCKLPLTSQESKVLAKEAGDDSKPQKPRPHEASLAHQVCLEHSHPPSHLDRSRKGLAYLSAYGWDPDSRLGLGATGQGIQFPIKNKEKNDKLGIGVVVPKDKDLEKFRKVKEVKLDAGKVRKMVEKDKKRTEELRELFYRNGDVEKYLGGGV